MSTFKEYFIDNQKHILIPALQRDYVQGERPDIIKPFIDELLFALKETTKKIEVCRESLANILGVKNSSNVIFTSGATRSINDIFCS